jgi:hypothetical protein
MSKILIGIHGLANKPASDVLAKDWKKSICEGLEKNEKIDNPQLNFSLVYWADVIYDAPRENPEPYHPAKEGMLKTYKENWLDSARAGIFDGLDDVIDSIKQRFGSGKLADFILKERLKALSTYYKNQQIRKTLRTRLKDEILKHQDKRIMILSHSMGSIIAYDVLREIGNHHSTLNINHFVTLGSPLGLPYVKNKIREENNLVRTPSIVKKWSNFADKRDIVALDTHLADDYFANDSSVQVKDDLVANDWEEGLHHKSYGYLRTPEVSKVISRFI